MTKSCPPQRGEAIFQRSLIFLLDKVRTVIGLLQVHHIRETTIMNLWKWFSRFSVENQGLNYKLSVIFGLFFLAPIAGFMYFAVKYDILSDEHIPIYFITILIFSFFGFILLRRLFDELIRVSKSISQTIAEEFSPSQTHQPEDELKSIVHSF